MQKYLILGASGIGKSYLEQNHEGVADCDLKEYMIKHNYTDENIVECLKAYRVYILESLRNNSVVLGALGLAFYGELDALVEDIKKENMQVVVKLACQTKDRFDETIQGHINRGDSEAFIANRKKVFYDRVDSFDKIEGYDQIYIGPGQYLTDGLIQSGVPLQQKEKLEYAENLAEITGKKE